MRSTGEFRASMIFQANALVQSSLGAFLPIVPGSSSVSKESPVYIALGDRIIAPICTRIRTSIGEFCVRVKNGTLAESVIPLHSCLGQSRD